MWKCTFWRLRENGDPVVSASGSWTHLGTGSLTRQYCNLLFRPRQCYGKGWWQVVRRSQQCIFLSVTTESLARQLCMVAGTLPFFAEIFAFRRDQYLTAAMQELLLQYVRILWWFPALFWDPPCTWIWYQRTDLQLSGGAECQQKLLADHREHVCMQASICVSDAGRCHPSLWSSLAAACNHCSGKAIAWVLRGGMQIGA